MALATAISRLSSLPPLRAPPQDDVSSITSEGMSPVDALRRVLTLHTDASSSTRASSLSSSFDSRSCHSEPASSPASIPRQRTNEHLAVLLPKRLWKPDSQAAHCDTFLCRKPFSIWERRHEVRRCLLHRVLQPDHSPPRYFRTRLPLPPRNHSIYEFEKKEAPVLDCRVCNDCWDQIHGRTTPRSPVVNQSHPISLIRNTEASSSTASSSSSVSSSVATPPEGSPLHSLPARPTIRRTHTSPRVASSPLRAPTPLSHSSSVHILDAELSLGELDSYPLKRASSICKANGGGRWEPKPIPEYSAKRIPGRKAAYELELEREEEERRLRRANPVFKNGDFQLRCPREIEPRSPAGPFTLSTF
ncbi:hypothetical protein C8Q80DRAFT_113165 [Daedaleopsis nitida]|nr:hypothetical protein C8Q80DRAFT_113165 [Daedaleopsis nitida]